MQQCSNPASLPAKRKSICSTSTKLKATLTCLPGRGRLVTSDGPADTQHASETGTHVRGDAPIDTTWVAKVKKRPRKERKTIRSRADMVAEYEADARGELMSEEDRVNGQPLEGEDYALPNEWSLPDLSCVDTSYNCARDAKSGACHTNPQSGSTLQVRHICDGN